MDRPRAKIDLETIRQLRKGGVRLAHYCTAILQPDQAAYKLDDHEERTAGKYNLNNPAVMYNPFG